MSGKETVYLLIYGTKNGTTTQNVAVCKTLERAQREAAALAGVEELQWSYEGSEEEGDDYWLAYLGDFEYIIDPMDVLP